MHWRYFISLEREFLTSMHYVEPTSDPDDPNFKAYSLAFLQLLLAIGSEVDVVCKVLCANIDPTKSAKNIDQYRSVIGDKYPKLYKTQVEVPRLDFELQPWKDWGVGKNPKWWKAYNGVKHERQHAFSDASFENVLSSLAGLFVLLLHTLGHDIAKGVFKPEQQVFYYPGLHQPKLVHGGRNIILPDIQFPHPAK